MKWDKNIPDTSGNCFKQNFTMTLLGSQSYTSTEELSEAAAEVS